MIDVIVLGLGAMGSSAAYHLAQRGKRVLGLEQFTPAHAQGSSHGSSRIIRQAYYEHPAYVPLLMRAYELWERLERDTNSRLLQVTGGLMIGKPASNVVSGSIQSAKQHGLRHVVLGSPEIRRRFPALTPAPDEVALYEYKAGYLLPEESIRQSLKEAARYGADLRFEEPVESWTDYPNGHIRVVTTKGDYEAAHLIVCSGAWTPQILADLKLPLAVIRQVMFWFDPEGATGLFLPDSFPIYMWQTDGAPPFYGFPAINGPRGGVKVAIHGSDNLHGGGVACTPGTIDRHVNESDILPMRSLLASRIPHLNGPLLTAKTCMYTMTPDQHFMIGIHPQHPCVTIAAGFSGHGFKFATVVGEILANFTTNGVAAQDIELFSMERFRKCPLARL